MKNEGIDFNTHITHSHPYGNPTNLLRVNAKSWGVDLILPQTTTVNDMVHAMRKFADDMERLSKETT